MNIYLIRHGTTTHNEEKRYTGKTDVSLSKNGINDLLKLVSKYKSISNLPIYTSTLKRTKETAMILFPSPNIIDQLEFMNETNFGDFEGLRYEDLKNDKDYQKWINDITGEIPKNGESYQVFKNRVIKGFLKHIKSLNEDTIYVTHGGVIRIIMTTLLNHDIPFFNWDIPNGGGYKLSLNDDVLRYEKI